MICSLLFDEMAIRKEIQLEGNQASGYVDVGIQLNYDDIKEASEALVFMVVSLTAHWKLPIGYFFIKSFNRC